MEWFELRRKRRAQRRLIDADEVYPGLWQGSRPPEGPVLMGQGFAAVVLCAKEWQPQAKFFPGTEVIHAPNDDDFSRMPTREELQLAVTAARRVAQLLSAGQKVLVTCMQGRNRSGLVSALATHILTGKDGETCINYVQANRARSLQNPGFQKALLALRGKTVQPQVSGSL